ncbi:MAG: glycine cleavage system protein H [Acidiferrobacteraceae bacterium]|nr:glycine cleavage system protein H [Acidiferrobacteraceae bacterium]|tara:strand:- start:364 stop:741 length:378 start_codon:yes stop_codon:yes gene_type:complete
MTNIKYTEDHEWASLEEDIVTVGITDFAQDQLGDLVFVELPNIDNVVKKGDEAAIIESVKAAGDVKSPMGGKIIEINATLIDAPEKVNQDPMGDGWFYKILISDINEWASLLDEKTYQEMVTSAS